MRTIVEYEHLGETEADIERITQASALGALADDVLLELIQLEAGIRKPADLRAVVEGATLFQAMAQQLRRPGDLWSSTSPADALRRLSSDTGSQREGVLAPNDEFPNWCERLSTQLLALQNEPKSAELLSTVRAQFTSIAQFTMRAAAKAARPYSSIV